MRLNYHVTCNGRDVVDLEFFQSEKMLLGFVVALQLLTLELPETGQNDQFIILDTKMRDNAFFKDSNDLS